MTIQELYAKRATAYEAAKEYLDKHRMENGTLSAEDAEVYDRMERDITNLTTEIDRLTRLQELEKAMSQPVNTPLTGKPGGGVSTASAAEPRGRASKQYAQDMLTAMRTNFRQVSDVLKEGTDENGGYLVPEEWDSRLIVALEEENIFRTLATQISTTGLHRINVAATVPTASWIEEEGEIQFTDATFKQKILDAHKLHVATKITEELLYDNAFGLDTFIINQFARAIGAKEEDAFLNGTGTNMPTGVFDKTDGGAYSVEIATADKITADDILTLVYALRRPYRRNAAFVMHDSTLAAIRKLKDGNGAYMWQPSYQAGEPDRVCGYPVYTSEYAPKLETGNGAIAFGDFSYYNIGDRGTRGIQQLNELYAANGMIGFVCKERVDGILVLQEAVQILSVKGGD